MMIVMSILPAAAAAMTKAFTRFETGASQFRDGVAGVAGANPALGAVAMIEAKAQLKSSVQIARVADAMLGDLLELQRRR